MLAVGRRATRAPLRRHLVATLAGLAVGTLITAEAATPTARVFQYPDWQRDVAARGAGDRLALRFPAMRFADEAELTPMGRPAPDQAEEGRQALDAIGAIGGGASGTAAPPADLLAFGSQRVPRELATTVMRAAAMTATSPFYLMALADKESSFRPQVRAGTSTASGLYQFIERTWLEMIRDFGPSHGLAAEAALVERGADGRPVVNDPAERARLLALRNDPYLAAVMAAELHKRDQQRIERIVTRPLRPVDFYLTHFFGSEEAERFLRAREDTPTASATQLFPAAARANRTLFSRVDGQGRRRRTVSVSVAELYDRIDGMIERRFNRFGSVFSAAGAAAPLAITPAATRASAVVAPTP